jgi:3-oxoadipate enol-lactonase
MSALVLESGVVHYEYFGRGRPLIFIHGWLGSWRYWVPAMDALSDEFRVYAFDLWGFGDSDKAKHEYSVRSYAELLHAFIQKLGVFGPIPLVGHALGAAVAIAFALEHPEEVDRVMAISLPLFAEAINRRFLAGNSSIFDRVLGRSPIGGYEEIEQEASRAAPDAIHDSVESVANLDLRSMLPALRQPLLVLYGENDGIVAPSPASAFQALNANVRVLSMPEARHFPMLDRSSQFNRLLADFLGADSDLHQLALKEEWQRRVR